MRLLHFSWIILVSAARGQQGDYYAPQTFRQEGSGGKSLFTPSSQSGGAGRAGDVTPQGSSAQPWKPDAPTNQDWKVPSEVPWRLPYAISKEQRAAILHHKQALTSDGSFRFEYASDNGLAAGEVIQPDGSRVGAYQYKDPSGQMVKLKYRAGKGGFQILEGSHLPQSPQPQQPASQDDYYQNAYGQQQQQYELQQQYNQQRPEPAREWQQGQGQVPVNQQGGQYYSQNWKADGGDDGQYRENEIADPTRPHSFGGGYSFAFKG